MAQHTVAFVGESVGTARQAGAQGEAVSRAGSTSRSDPSSVFESYDLQTIQAGNVAESDEVLLAGMQRCNVRALERFYDRYHRIALGLANRMLDDREEAEDVVQEAFLAVWRRSGSFDSTRGNPRGWLLSIVHHRCIDRLRRTPSVGEAVALDEAIEDQRAPEVFQAAYENLQREQIVRALHGLPREQRETIELAYFGGRTHVEIAEEMHVPLGTVKGRLRIGLQKLRSLLDGAALGL